MLIYATSLLDLHQSTETCLAMVISLVVTINEEDVAVFYTNAAVGIEQFPRATINFGPGIVRKLFTIN